MRLGFFNPLVLPLPSVCHSFAALVPRVPREMPTTRFIEHSPLQKSPSELRFMPNNNNDKLAWIPTRSY
jgi:hypothetical protein